jgi:hypothetical protein
MGICRSVSSALNQKYIVVGEETHSQAMLDTMLQHLLLLLWIIVCRLLLHLKMTADITSHRQRVAARLLSVVARGCLHGAANLFHEGFS